MNIPGVLIREQVLVAIRSYFSQRNFHEVIVPTLARSLPLEPTVHAFQTTRQTVRGNTAYYLSTSPEAGLKKMLAAGLGNCYAIGKSFRNLEAAGSRHRPEFLMLEWYRQDATYTEIMTDVQELLAQIAQTVNRKTLVYQNQTIPLTQPWKRYTMSELFEIYAHVPLTNLLDLTAMVQCARAKGYSTDQASWEQLFHQIFLNEIEPHLTGAPCFVTDFPAQISPLCKPKEADARFAERFEVYLAGIEMGNGNTEQTDVGRVRAQFEQEQKRRELAGIIAPPIDAGFLAALETMNQSGRSYAGIGMGVDRLAMLFADVTDISEVEPLVISI